MIELPKNMRDIIEEVFPHWFEHFRKCEKNKLSVRQMMIDFSKFCMYKGGELFQADITNGDSCVIGEGRYWKDVKPSECLTCYEASYRDIFAQHTWEDMYEFMFKIATHIIREHRE